MKMQTMRRGLAGIVATGLIIAGFGISGNPASAAPVVNTHTVTSNDTIYRIALQYGIDLQGLLESNPQLADPSNIWQGIQIQLPGTETPDKETPATETPVTGVPAGNPNSGGTGATDPGSTGTETGTQDSAYAAQVIDLVNQERSKAGLSALSSDPALTRVALDKAKDMYHNNYFDHNSPTYGSPFDMMRSYGVQYSYAGENIASGQRTPQEVVTAWMNSPGHRANILSSNFTKIGVAYYNGEWVQEFTG